MDDFINVNKNDPQVRNKINDMLDRYNRLLYKYQSEKGFYTLIRNVILEEMIILMGTTKVYIDIEIKMKISRKWYLEGRWFWLWNFISI